MSHPAWIGNWTQPPGMVGSNGTAGFSSRRMPCILLLEKPVLVVVWLQCNIGLRHSAFGVGGLAEDTPSAPTEPRTCTWGEGVAYATKATHSPQRRACCKATFFVRHHDATKAMRGPQRHAHRWETTFWDAQRHAWFALGHVALRWAWLPDDVEGLRLQHHLVVKLN